MGRKLQLCFEQHYFGAYLYYCYFIRCLPSHVPFIPLKYRLEAAFLGAWSKEQASLGVRFWIFMFLFSIFPLIKLLVWIKWKFIIKKSTARLTGNKIKLTTTISLWFQIKDSNFNYILNSNEYWAVFDPKHFLDKKPYLSF